nr:lytic murein transglycosylase B [uncultured Holophaga sp.]
MFCSRHLLVPCLLAPFLAATPPQEPPALQAFIQGMAEHHGFDPVALRTLLGNTTRQERARQWVLPPASPLQRNWRVYRTRFIEPQRLKAGLHFWKTHEKALRRAQNLYGVPPEAIVGILGVETLYGSRTGNFPVLDTLVTLAFDYPDIPGRPSRAPFFQDELEAYLLWCRDTAQDPRPWHGSYTGAMGMPQFMPSSIRKWAVDFDGDGRIDLAGSAEDAIGSVARYLKDHGWRPGEPIDLPISGPTALRAAATLADGRREPHRSLAVLRESGVRTPRSRLAPDTPALIVDLPTPGHPTEYRVGLSNFFALTEYNRSYFYAAAVADLGRAVKARLKHPKRVIMDHRSDRP